MFEKAYLQEIETTGRHYIWRYDTTQPLDWVCATDYFPRTHVAPHDIVLIVAGDGARWVVALDRDGAIVTEMFR